MLYEISTGKGCQEFPEPPTGLGAAAEEAATRELNEVILRACQPQARDRYQSADQMHADLVLLQAGKSVWHLRKVERRLALLTRLGLAAAVLVLVAAGAYFFQRQQSQQFKSVAEEKQRLAEESQERLVRLNVAHGLRLLDEGDYLRALPWFAEAHRLEQRRPAEAALHRLRLEAVMKQSPRLLQLWFHAGRVNAAEFSADGRYAVTASQDQTARVWDVDSGQPLTPPLQHSGAVLRAEFSPDSRRVLTVAAEGARIWDAPTGQLLVSLRHPNLSHGAFSPNGARLVTTSHDGTAKVWDAASFKEALPTLRHRGAILHAAFSADNQWLVTASADRTARLWDLATGAVRLEVQPRREVRRAELNPDGSRLLASAMTASVWDTTTGSNIFEFQRGGPASLYHATFSPDGQWVACSDWDGVARIWSADTGQLIHTLAHGNSQVMESVFSPDSTLLLTRHFSGRVQVWTVQDGKSVAPCLPLGASATSARFHPDGRRVLTAGADGSVRLWDLMPAGLAVIPWPTAKTRIVDWSPDGRRLFTQTPGGALQIWDTASWQTNGVALVLTSKVAQVFCPREGDTLLTVEDVAGPILWKGGPVVLKRWDLATGQFIREADLVVTPMYGKQPYLLRFNPTGTQLAFAHTNSLVVWDRMKHTVLWHSKPHHPSPSWVIGYRPDGRCLAINCANLVHVFDAVTGRELYPPLTNLLAVSWVEFSPDGRLLVSAGADRSRKAGDARVWEADTGKLLRCLPHEDGVLWATFSPDNSRVATASADHTARVWSLASGAPVTAPLWHGQRVGALAFSPDGRMLATGSDDSTARIWDANTGEPLTAPLAHSASVIQVFFLAAQPYLITETYEGFYLWELRPCSCAPADLLMRAQLLAAHQVRASSGLEPLDRATLSHSWQALRVKFPDEFRFMPTQQSLFPNAFGGQARPPSPIPARARKTPTNLLDLTPHYNWTLHDTWDPSGPGTDFRRLPTGLQRLAGVDFDLRGVIRLTSSELARRSALSYPRHIAGIKVGQKCARLHFLHSTSFLVPDGTVIGHYVLRYANGVQREAAIVYGENTRGWYLSSDASLKFNRSTKVAWSGTTGYGETIRLFLFTLENPWPDVEVRTLDFRSAMTAVAPFLIAVTVE